MTGDRRGMADDIGRVDVLRRDRTSAIHRGVDGAFRSTVGFCVPEPVRLAGDLVRDLEIEFPERRSVFECRARVARRASVCSGPVTVPARPDGRRILGLIE